MGTQLTERISRCYYFIPVVHIFHLPCDDPRIVRVVSVKKVHTGSGSSELIEMFMKLKNLTIDELHDASMINRQTKRFYFSPCQHRQAITEHMLYFFVARLYLFSRPDAPAGSNKNQQMHAGWVRHYDVLGFLSIYERSQSVSPATNASSD